MMPASIGFYGLPEDAMTMGERMLAGELDRMNSQSESRRPSTNRHICLALFSAMTAYMKYQLERQGCTATRKNTMITSDHCCTKALEDLKPIFLKQMKVPHVHAGRYLLCRTITETTSVAIEFIVYVEDSKKDVEMITFYNFTSDFSKTSWLPNGSLLLIKEPVLKYVNVNNQASIILDSPSDVIFVDETDLSMKQFAGDSVPWFKADKLSFEENKTKGNQLFGIKDYEGALKFYQRALRLQPASPVISLNRAAALLKMERFYEAYQEAELALNAGCNREKALFRLGKAAYGMRDYQKAQRHFQTCLQEFPGLESDAPVELALVAKRLQEEAGQVDISSLYDAEEEGNILHLDIADYNTPVAIADIPGKGKGLVATLDVEPGTLLMVSKAFAVTHPIKEQILVHRKKQGVESVYGGTWIRNMIKVVETLRKNPHRAKELYSLHADELDRDEEIPPGVVDTARIMKICKNSDRFAKTDKHSKEYSINGQAYVESPHGLWTLPTFMNHSCLDFGKKMTEPDEQVMCEICCETEAERNVNGNISLKLPRGKVWTKETQMRRQMFDPQHRIRKRCTSCRFLKMKNAGMKIPIESRRSSKKKAGMTPSCSTKRISSRESPENKYLSNCTSFWSQRLTEEMFEFYETRRIENDQDELNYLEPREVNEQAAFNQQPNFAEDIVIFAQTNKRKWSQQSDDNSQQSHQSQLMNRAIESSRSAHFIFCPITEALMAACNYYFSPKPNQNFKRDMEAGNQQLNILFDVYSDHKKIKIIRRVEFFAFSFLVYRTYLNLQNMRDQIQVFLMPDGHWYSKTDVLQNRFYYNNEDKEQAEAEQNQSAIYCKTYIDEMLREDGEVARLFLLDIRKEELMILFALFAWKKLISQKNEEAIKELRVLAISRFPVDTDAESWVEDVLLLFDAIMVNVIKKFTTDGIAKSKNIGKLATEKGTGFACLTNENIFSNLVEEKFNGLMKKLKISPQKFRKV